MCEFSVINLFTSSAEDFVSIGVRRTIGIVAKQREHRDRLMYNPVDSNVNRGTAGKY